MTAEDRGDQGPRSPDKQAAKESSSPGAIQRTTNFFKSATGMAWAFCGLIAAATEVERPAFVPLYGVHRLSLRDQHPQGKSQQGKRDLLRHWEHNLWPRRVFTTLARTAGDGPFG